MQVLPFECNLKGYNCQTRIQFQGFEKASCLQQCFFFKKNASHQLNLFKKWFVLRYQLRKKSSIMSLVTRENGSVNLENAF